jgi:actinorhodin biosynthesis protein ActVIA
MGDSSQQALNSTSGDVISSTNLYAEVQQFYAMQMQRLDRRDVEGYAATFTDDGEFIHRPGEPGSETRAGILRAVKKADEMYETDPHQRRHYFNMVNLEPLEGGSIKSTVYCLVIKIRSGQQPEFVSCVVSDILVRVDGELLTQYRAIEYD